MRSIITPVVLDGYVQWVHPWRVAPNNQVWLYEEEFATPYCPINFEVSNDSI